MNKLIIIGLFIAFVGAVLAPYLAVTTPDGLEKTLETIKNPGIEEKAAIESPMPDYKVPFLGDSPMSTTVAAIIGMLLVFGLSYGIGLIIKKRKNKENTE
ncbi:MAG: PDGLE domain-containing protein [Methanobacterium sp.]|uniref:PDGLE domain-containing protein n=1 Tax=Methanobacterium sp. TaxID=2164 RepID=UPI003D646860|nr:PDGLE domain-containing protein [Methanobacterium sp.]